MGSFNNMWLIDEVLNFKMLSYVKRFSYYVDSSS